MLHECVMTWKHKYCWQSLLWFYAETLLKTKWSAILKYWPQHHMLWRYEANTCCTGVLWGQRSALPLATVKIFGPILLLIYKKMNPYNDFLCQYTFFLCFRICLFLYFFICWGNCRKDRQWHEQCFAKLPRLSCHLHALAWCQNWSQHGCHRRPQRC